MYIVVKLVKITCTFTSIRKLGIDKITHRMMTALTNILKNGFFQKPRRNGARQLQCDAVMTSTGRRRPGDPGSRITEYLEVTLRCS